MFLAKVVHSFATYMYIRPCIQISEEAKSYGVQARIFIPKNPWCKLRPSFEFGSRLSHVSSLSTQWDWLTNLRLFVVVVLILGQLLILGQGLYLRNVWLGSSWHGSSLTWVKLTQVKFDLGQVETGEVWFGSRLVWVKFDMGQVDTGQVWDGSSLARVKLLCFLFCFIGSTICGR